MPGDGSFLDGTITNLILSWAQFSEKQKLDFVTGNGAALETSLDCMIRLTLKSIMYPGWKGVKWKLICGGRGQKLGRKADSRDVEKVRHSCDAVSKARPGPRERTDLPQIKETGPLFCFFCLFVFPSSEFTPDWLALTMSQWSARRPEWGGEVLKKRSTTPLEHLIPVGATLWSRQAPKSQPKAPPHGSWEAASAWGALGLASQAGT